MPAAFTLCLLAGLAVRPGGVQTGPAISAGDLRVRLEAFAHDSMAGRKSGTPALEKATEYIAGELRRAGVRGRGDRGSYFQNVPLVEARVDLPKATLATELSSFIPGIDFIPVPGAHGIPFARSARTPRARFRYGGPLDEPQGIGLRGDTGSIVVFTAPRDAHHFPDYRIWEPSVVDALAQRHTAAIVVATLEHMPRQVRARLTGPWIELESAGSARDTALPVIAVTQSVAQVLTSVSTTNSRALLTASFEIRREPLSRPSRNVVAFVEGRDPRLRSEFVVLTAHADHLGVAPDADAESGDVVYNGADDGGSGSVALIEIAEYFASLAEKPLRSILFVWTAAEEQGALGSRWFVEHSLVPVSSVVAVFNVDMIGRGNGADVAGGGANYLQLIGARRRSTEFAAWIDEVNQRPDHGFAIDSTLDADAHHDRVYCAGDHWSFARLNIPTVLVTTGGHVDYHRVTDDVKRIDFAKYDRVTRFVAGAVLEVANRPSRPRVDRPRPEPRAWCGVRP